MTNASRCILLQNMALEDPDDPQAVLPFLVGCRRGEKRGRKSFINCWWSLIAEICCPSEWLHKQLWCMWLLLSCALWELRHGVLFQWMCLSFSKLDAFKHCSFQVLGSFFFFMYVCQIYGASSLHNHFKLVQQMKQGWKDCVKLLNLEVLFLVIPLAGIFTWTLK